MSLISKLIKPQTSIIIITIWMAIIASIFIIFGVFDSDFFIFGPSAKTKFFERQIDTWAKWFVMITFTFVNQIIASYGLETISPWIINQVQNEKVNSIETSYVATQSIIFIYYTFLWMSRIIGIWMSLSQFSFLVVILIADLSTNFGVIHGYLRAKDAAHTEQQTMTNMEPFHAPWLV